MIATVITIIFASILFIYEEGIDNSFWIPLLFIVSSTLFLASQGWIIIKAWTPLQKAEMKLTPKIMETFYKDNNLKWTHFGFLAFFLLSSFLTLDLTILKFLPPLLALVIWIPLLGVACDLKIHTIRRIMRYLNPFEVVNMYEQKALTCIRNSNDLELCLWIDSLSETANLSINRSSPSLTIHSMDTLSKIIKTYLETEKSLSHRELDEAKQMGVTDPISFILFFTFQRIETIYQKALKNHLELVCSDLIALLGKIAIAAAEFDVTLASFPVHYIGKFALLSQEENLQIIAERATLTLYEVGKAITKAKDLQYLEIKDPFLSIINYMDKIAKETFRKNKETNIKLLIQPFKDLKVLFKAENITSHRDTAVIEQNINHVIEEFTTLETVMATMPRSI